MSLRTSVYLAIGLAFMFWMRWDRARRIKRIGLDFEAQYGHVGDGAWFAVWLLWPVFATVLVVMIVRVFVRNK